MTGSSLSNRRIRFIQEYLVDFSASAAAVRAGYAPEYGEKLLRDEVVQDAIDLELHRRNCDSKERQELVIRELLSLIQVNPADAYDEKGNILPPSKFPPALQRALKSFGDGKYSICDKLKAIELLGKHLQMFRDHVEYSGAVSTTINVINPFAVEGEVVDKSERELPGEVKVALPGEDDGSE